MRFQIEKTKYFIFLALTVLTVLTGCKRDERPLEIQLKEVLNDGIKEYQINGASVAVILPDGQVIKVTTGYSHDTVIIKPDMLFAIGSITKTMVATLILQLAEEGILSLNDPLYKWLPDYPFVDREIKIRHLLNHTSGLYMFWDNDELWDDLKKYRDNIFSPESVMNYIKEPYFEKGRNYRYSNTNYLLLAMIATKATNSTLSHEFRERFWISNDINNAFLTVEEEIPENIAHVWSDNFENDGSVRDVTFLPRNSHESITYGSSGLFMTAEDLAKWSLLLFQGKIINETSLNKMLNFGKGGYGLGVGFFKSILGGGTQAVGHFGGNIGTTTGMIYSRKHNISLVLMINSYNVECAFDLSEKLGKKILKSL